MADVAASIPTLRLARPPRSVTALEKSGQLQFPAAGNCNCPDFSADGLPLALEQEWAAVKSARQTLAVALERCQTLQGELVRQSEAQLVELALEIASRVLLQEVRAKAYDIDPIVKEALARVPARREAVVRLHPADLERCTLAGKSGQLQLSAADNCNCPDFSSVRFVADPSLQRTQCVVETAEGFVQTDIASHLQAIADLLREGC